ncbi:PAS domain S-box protein [Piscinibacter sp. XHJ-5]|uniref:PAS domain S-box protein n=1 Tax=Piscinibacter sp. XHJ-5 TaxID=3037797 RepID=UPI002453088B|nr:PAS domain S-box protein [Piscinibacter sp. XHJ-5]
MNDDVRHLHWSPAAAWADAGRVPMEASLAQSLLYNITARVAVVGRDQRYRYANRELLRFLGLGADDLIGRRVDEVLGAAATASYAPIAERVFAGEALSWEGWVDYSRYGRRYLQETLIPYDHDGARFNAVVVFGRDHTELKLREQEVAARQQALTASETLKSAIVDNALAALVSTDASGCIVEFNPAAEAMFGRARADVLGHAVSELLMPERFRAAHQAGLDRLQAGGEPRVLGKRMSLHALRADGSEFPIEMVLWRTDVGGAVFYTASMADLTERHNAAQQIERQREALRQSEKLTAMGSLLAGVAHELNNPLAIVMGRASLLEEKCEQSPLGEEIRADVQRIREAAERCGRIVRTFLNMARSRPSQRASIAIEQLVLAAVDMLHYGFRSHGIEVELRLAEGLPTVYADADQIGQVVLNLLVNAQQALDGKPGERRVAITSGVETLRNYREPRVWLCVADTGPGVPAEMRTSIFEPFFTTKADGIGTGLGLPMSRSLAREHGGDLTLEPSRDSGFGAIFRLSLPVSGESEAVVDAPPAAAEPRPVARILVVDDEPEISALMRDMLERAGYEVASGESAAVALELLDTARFDAIVSDLRMPDMDGAAFRREVLARHPELARRMLFVTGDTLSPNAREFLKSARSESLEKPFSKEDLLARVARLLE